jgi:hypothetical protein
MNGSAKVLIRCAASALALLAVQLAFAAGGAERDEVLGTVQKLLDGWREADPSKVDAALHPEFREVTLHLQGTEWQFAPVSRSTLIGTVGKIQKGAWDDRLIDPQVHVDGPIAVVWSRYKFTVHYEENGVAQAPEHCGVETFQLYRQNAVWKIVNFADTHVDKCP